MSTTTAPRRPGTHPTRRMSDLPDDPLTAALLALPDTDPRQAYARLNAYLRACYLREGERAHRAEARIRWMAKRAMFPGDRAVCERWIAADERAEQKHRTEMKAAFAARTKARQQRPGCEPMPEDDDGDE